MAVVKRTLYTILLLVAVLCTSMTPAITSAGGNDAANPPLPDALPTSTVVPAVPHIISDGQFVFGPNVHGFDLHRYLTDISSPLLNQADAIEAWCLYASVNPRLVLTLLEMDGMRVTGAQPRETERGASDAPMVTDEQLEDLVTRLANSFYQHLYAAGSRSTEMPAPESIILDFNDGTTLAVTDKTSSASFAVWAAWAPTHTKAQLDHLSLDSNPDGFQQTWLRLFPADHPLDSANVINAPSAPPSELLQFPFPVGQTWYFNGTHNWNGGGLGRPFSSMDFYTSGGSCGAPPNDYSVAAAAGNGYHPNGAYCWYRIDHGSGWMTSYYHLRNVRNDGGVNKNDPIGTIACETCVGGRATGPHVHFSLLYNGAYAELNGTRLSGWTVASGSGTYDSGYIERDGQQKTPYSTVRNDGTGAPPPSGNQVELYRRANYDDRFWSGGTGRHDNISPSAYSMKVPSGWSVKTWRETGFRGDERCWTGSVNNLQDHGWQLAIRSLEVFDRNVCPTAPPPSSDKVELFRRANYDDRFWSGGTGRHDNISPSAYSMKLPSGWSIITWRENGYRGDSRCWMGSVTNLQDHGWQLAIRSVEVFNRNACPPSKPALQSPAHGATLAAGSAVVLDWSGADNATEYAAEYWGPTGHHNSGRRTNTDWNIGQLPAGTYEWHVEAYNSQGWSGWTSNRAFTVLPPAPSASFDAWPISGQAPLTSRMHIVSTANITSCQWNYGDGRTGNSCQGVHDYTYANPGSYTVQLTVSGPGGTDTKTRTNYITVNSAPPTANFDAAPRTGQPPLTVRMHNTSQGNIASCVWNYGDGNSGNSCSEYHEHIYARAGTYSINLTVTGPGGTNNRTQNAHITVSAPPNPTDCADGEGVILYENPNHTGRCTRFTGDDSDLGNDPIGDNQASSIRIIGNYEASLYVNAGYSGSYSTFTADDPDLGNDAIGHDRASAIRVRRRDAGGTSNCDGGPGVYLYQQANYAGRCSKFTSDSPDPANWYIGNDTASAIRIIGSYEAVLYENGGYQGASSTFIADDPDLSNDAIRSGRTSSIRVRQRTSGSSNCDNGPGVYLYEHANYAGRCSKFTADSPNPGNWYLGNDAASSLRIIGDYEAVVFEHDNYQGQNSTFIRDDPDFGNDAIQHDRTSSVRVRPLASGPTHCSDGQFLGEYFDNINLAGSPIFRRCDSQVNFDWGAGSPDARIPGDNFSVRWTGRFWFDAGTYRFTTRTDDGVRLWINDLQLINEWRDMAVTSVARDKTLTSGAYTLRMEYYEHGGAAIAGLTWPRQQQASGDPDDGRLITYGSSLDGTVNPAGDRDDYDFDGSSGQAITIRMDKRASTLDSYIELYNPDGSLLGQDDDNGGDRNSRIAITLRQNGRHKVIARGYSSSTGGYRLSLERESTADPDDNRWIAFGNTLQGTISPNNDRDWYYFSGTAGRSVSIQMRKTDGQLDAYLELYNAAGVKVAQNDDGLGNRDSWIIYTLPAGGTYRILARSYNLSSSGRYNLSLASMSNANLARGKPTVASSVEAPGLEAPRATDGSTGTRWSSRYNHGEWIQVDLGQDRTFNQVVLKWEAAHGKAFGIYYRSSSMCSTCWMQAYWTNNGQGGTNTINFNPVRARYVLMYGFERGTSWGYSLWEFEIYDNSALVLPLVPPDPGDKPAEEVEQVAPLAPNDEDKSTLLIGEGDAGQEVTPLAGAAPLAPTLDVRPDAPTVFILYPSEETPVDEEILFQGIAVDSIGGEQTIAEYLWLSSIDGPLAAVNTFSLPAASLSPGRHVITFQARTEGGEWSGPVSTEIVVEEGNTHRLYLPLIQQSQ